MIFAVRGRQKRSMLFGKGSDPKWKEFRLSSCLIRALDWLAWTRRMTMHSTPTDASWRKTWGTVAN